MKPCEPMAKNVITWATGLAVLQGGNQEQDEQDYQGNGYE